MRRNQSLKDQLEATFERAKRIDVGEIELQSDFARYLCVQVSGFLEQSVRNATTEYARNRSDKCVANYVARSVNRLTNLDSEKIKEHLLKFDQDWGAPLNALLADEVKDAINSVVALRHQIAHGQPADITIGRVLGYYNKISRAVTELEKLLQIDEYKAR